MAVSSVKVLCISYIVTDPRSFPGGHPRPLEMGVKFRCCMLSRSIYFVNRILGD